MRIKKIIIPYVWRYKKCKSDLCYTLKRNDVVVAEVHSMRLQCPSRKLWIQTCNLSAHHLQVQMLPVRLLKRNTNNKTIRWLENTRKPLFLCRRSSLDFVAALGEWTLLAEVLRLSFSDVLLNRKHAIFYSKLLKMISLNYTNSWQI